MSPIETRTDLARGLYLDLLNRTLTRAVAEDTPSIPGAVRTSGSSALRKTWGDTGIPEPIIEIDGTGAFWRKR